MKEIARIRYAEEAPYWKTSRTAAEDWVEKAKRVIVGAGGRVLADMVLNVEGKTTYVIKFAMAIDGQEREYRIDWPVLKSRAGDERAAKVQAATVLYHAVKSLLLLAIPYGPRASHLIWELMPDQKTTVLQAAAQEFQPLLPPAAKVAGDMRAEECEVIA